MDRSQHTRTHSVLSVRSSGLHIRASKLFSKFKLQSKSNSTNASPYLDIQENHKSTNRESLKPYMSQPVLGLTLGRRMDEDEDLHSPASNTGASSGNDATDIAKRTDSLVPLARASLETIVSTSKSIISPSHTNPPIQLNFPSQTVPQPPPTLVTVTNPSTTSPRLPVDGLPNPSTNDNVDVSGLPGSTATIQDLGHGAARPSSNMRPQIPSRLPPPPPNDANITPRIPSEAAPSIVVSRVPSLDVQSRSSIYSISSELSTLDGYATAPSSPGFNAHPLPEDPMPTPYPDPQKEHSSYEKNDVPASTTKAFMETDGVLYDEPASIMNTDSSHDLHESTEASQPTPKSSELRHGKRTPAPRFTDPLPASKPPTRTFTAPNVPDLPNSPGPDGLHRRFSTAPGRRGSLLVVTPSGETARFSPSIITYQRLPPSVMKLPFPSPSISVDEQGRMSGSPSPSGTPSSTWNGFTRGVSEGSPSFWRSPPQSGSVSRKATLREMPAMSVGGEMDNGDDGDNDSSDGSDHDSDEDGGTVAENGDDDTTESMTASTSSQPEPGALSEALWPKRLWSFSSMKDRGKSPSRQFSQDSSASLTPTGKELANISSLPDLEESRFDMASILDPKGKGKARETSDHSTPVGPSRQSTIKNAPRSKEVDYYSGQTSEPSIPDSRTPSSPKTHGGSGMSVRTVTGGYRPSDVSIPPVPAIPKSVRMPPIAVHGEDGQYAMYKHASFSMIDILTPREEDTKISLKLPFNPQVEKDGGIDAHGAQLNATLERKTSNLSGHETGPGLTRRRSMPTFNPSTDAPPYPTFQPGPFKQHPGLQIHPREDEGVEALPPYSNSILLKAIMPMKMEFTAPGIMARDRKWKRVICVLEGTAFKLYHCRVGKNVPGGVSALGSWWERKVGAPDVSLTSASNVASMARAGKEKERERQRQLETVRKLEVESGLTSPGSTSGTTDIVIPDRDTPGASTSSRFSQPKLKPHSRSRSDISAMSRLSSPGSPRSSFSVAPGVNGFGGARMSLDVNNTNSSGDSRSSLSLSLQNNASGSSASGTGLQSSSSSIHSANSQSFTSSITDVIPDPCPSDLIRAYSLQNAESGLGNDYVKRRNVIRVRMEDTQFLLQATDVSEVVDWIEALHAAANVALDLDERPMPKGPLFPRRRRRRRRPQASGTVEVERTTESLNMNGSASRD